jgi:cytidine deaminase
LADSDRSRVSVMLADVSAGLEPEFLALASEFDATLTRKGYGRDRVVRDEGVPLRFYTIRTWIDADAAERCHGDLELQRLTTRLYQIARVTQVINGARRPDPMRLLLDDRRAHIEPDRRTGFDRRVKDTGGPQGDRRDRRDRRLGPRRLREHAGGLDLVGAARRAREHADAAFSNFKVGAALETAYGLTMCAERVAMFKALSEGHRAFTRIAIVADTEAPTPPCGACRQVLWEFGGNLEIKLGNLTKESGTHRLQDLLPLPFDARLL